MNLLLALHHLTFLLLVLQHLTTNSKHNIQNLKTLNLKTLNPKTVVMEMVVVFFPTIQPQITDTEIAGETTTTINGVS